MRFPFGPLEEAVSAPTNGVLAEMLGVNVRQVFRLRERGLTTAEADEYAVRAGFHPAEVWGADYIDYKNSSRRARYSVDEDMAAARRATAARYYAENGDYVRQRERRRYWSDPQAGRQRARDYYERNREAVLERRRQRRTVMGLSHTQQA